MENLNQINQNEHSDFKNKFEIALREYGQAGTKYEKLKSVHYTERDQGHELSVTQKFKDSFDNLVHFTASELMQSKDKKGTIELINTVFKELDVEHVLNDEYERDNPFFSSYSHSEFIQRVLLEILNTKTS